MGFGPTRNQHTGIGRPVVTGRPEVHEGLDVRCSSGVHRFCSDVLWSDVQSGTDVWGVGRPVVFGNPAFWLGCGSAGRPELGVL